MCKTIARGKEIVKKRSKVTNTRSFLKMGIMYSRTYFFLKLLSLFESQDIIQITNEQMVSNYDA